MKRVSRHKITHHRQIFISHNQKNGVLQLATSDEVAYTPPSASFCSYCYYFYMLQNSHKTLYAPGKQFYARSNFYSKFTTFMYVPFFVDRKILPSCLLSQNIHRVLTENKCNTLQMH